MAEAGGVMPSLRHFADISIEVGLPIAIGETAEGLRRIVPILGGTLLLSGTLPGERQQGERQQGERQQGESLRGKVLAAGADYQVIRQDGFTTLDARYAAQLDDGALIYIVNKGVRFGPPEVMAKITRGEPVDPSDVYFRTTPRFETAAAAHQWMMRPLFLATGARYPDRVEMSIFEVG